MLYINVRYYHKEKGINYILLNAIYIIFCMHHMNICNDYVPFVKFACSDVYSCTAC